MNNQMIEILVVLAVLLGLLLISSLLKKRKKKIIDEQFNSKNQEIADLKRELSTKGKELEKIKILASEIEEKLVLKTKELEDDKIFSSQLNENDVIKILNEELISKTSELENKVKEIKELENNIEDLEDEVEDLEDDLSSNKKKLSQSKSDYKEVSEKLISVGNNLKSTQLHLTKTNQKFKEVNEENRQKTNAINFVNEILNAKDSNDKDAVAINNAVSNFENIFFDQYLSLYNLQGDNSYFKEYFNPDEKYNDIRIATKWAKLQKKTWLKNKKVIALIGEFSAGKTSIVNRILSQDDPKCPKLPVSSKATTAIATYISYGGAFISNFTNPEGNLKQISKSFFEGVNKEILTQVNVSSIIRHFVIKYNNPNLKGLSILDTPGFSSNDKEDENRTLDVIHEADALFWVMDANSGEINRTSLKVLSENLNNIPLYIIINKADTKSNNELNKLEQHIRQTMNNANINISGYLRFSINANLDELMQLVRQLKGVYNNSDINVLYTRLSNAIYQLNELHKQKVSEQHQYERTCEISIENINNLLESQMESANTISSIPQFNERWFHDNDYRMAEDEYNNLCDLCNQVQCNTQEFINNINQLLESQANYSNVINEISELNNQLIMLENVQNQLNNAINSVLGLNN